MRRANICLLLSLCILFTLLGCEDSGGYVTPVRSGDIELDDAPYKLYWFDIPTGKEYSEGYNEYEYSYTSYSTKESGVTERTFDYFRRAIMTRNGSYAVFFHHWTEPKEYYTGKLGYVPEGKPYGNPDVDYHEYEIYDEAPRKLMLMSMYTLEPTIYEFEFTEAELKASMPRFHEPDILNLRSTPDGGFSGFLDDRAEEKLHFVRWDKDGKRVAAISNDSLISAWPYYSKSDPDTNSDQDIYNCDYTVAQNGNSYFLVEDMVVAFSSEGEHLYTVELSQTIAAVEHSITLDKDGNAVMLYTMRLDGSAYYVYSAFDDSGKRLGEPVKLYPSTSGPELQLAPGNDAYAITSNGIEAVNSGKDNVMLVRWADYDLTSAMIDGVQVVDAEHFFLKIEDPDTDEERFALLTTTDIEGHEPVNRVAAKHTLTIAYVASNNARIAKSIEQYVAEFNRTNEDYRAVLVAYSADGDLSANNALVKEMLSGKIPDMIVFDSDMGPEAFARLNTFCNLYEFMDSDPVYGREQFLSCVLEPFENGKGELPYLTLQFGISTISAKRSTMGERGSWTIKELADYSSSLAADQYLMDISGSSSTDDATMMLRVLLPSTLSSYVDYEAGSCNFGDNLKALLELCKSANVSRSINGVEAKLYKNGTMATRAVNNMDSVQDFLANRYAYFSGEELSYIGFPTEGDCGTVIVPMTSLAITKQCVYTEGAWSFIKSCLDQQSKAWIYDPDAQSLDVPGGFPCTTATAEKMLKTYKHYYFVSFVLQSQTNPDALSLGGSNGGLHFNSDGTYREMGFGTGAGVTYYTVTEEDSEELLELFDSITMVRSYDTELLSIIYEDASYYFAGTKSLDETVKIIENRVKLLLNE